MGRFRSWLLFWVMVLARTWNTVYLFDPVFWSSWNIANSSFGGFCWFFIYRRQYREMRSAWFRDQCRRRRGQCMREIHVWDP